MQPHTTPTLAALVEAGSALTPTELTLGTTLILLAIAIGASIFGNLTASLLLARPLATIGRAAVTLLLQFAAAIGFALISVIIAIVLGGIHTDRELIFVALGLAVIIYLLIAVSIPMQVYQIGGFRSIIFIILSALCAAIVQQVAVSAAVGPIDYASFSPQFRKLAERANFDRSVSEAEAQEFEKKRADLSRRFEQLEIRRKYIAPYDRKAIADYERDRAAYDRDLEQFRAEYGQ